MTSVKSKLDMFFSLTFIKFFVPVSDLRGEVTEGDLRGHYFICFPCSQKSLLKLGQNAKSRLPTKYHICTNTETWVACDKSKSRNLLSEANRESVVFWHVFLLHLEWKLNLLRSRRCHDRLCWDLHICNSLEKLRYPEHWGTTQPALRLGFLCYVLCRVVLKTNRTTLVCTCTHKKRGSIGYVP